MVSSSINGAPKGKTDEVFRINVRFMFEKSIAKTNSNVIVDGFYLNFEVYFAFFPHTVSTVNDLKLLT